MTGQQSILIKSDEKLKAELMLADMIGRQNAMTGERVR